MLRVKEETNKAVTILAGQLQVLSGTTVSANDAIWHMLSELYPDIIKRIEDEEADESSEDNT